MALITKEESKRVLDAWFKYYTKNLDKLVMHDNAKDEARNVIVNLTNRGEDLSYKDIPAYPVSIIYDELVKKYKDHVITLDRDAWDEMDMSAKITMALQAYYL